MLDPTAWRGVPQEVSTGILPGWDRVEELVREAHSRYAGEHSGGVADYIPVLAEVDPELFGLVVIEVGGGLHDAGDALHPFSIQSISKMFVYALAIQEHGHERVRDIVGVNNTGLAFNSVMAVELNDGHPMNPMVNAGAIATTALMPGRTTVEQWERVREGLSAFAGRPLSLDGVVYASEAQTNDRNRALGRLLRSYGRLEGDPDEVVDVYTRQCALAVTAHDLAVMGATLADGESTPSAVSGSSRKRCAETPWPWSRRPGCTNAPATGCSRSGFRRSPASPEASSRSPPGRARWPASRHGSTRPETRSDRRWRSAICRASWG